MYIANWGFWVVPWDVFRNLEYLNGVPYSVMHFDKNVTVPGFGSTSAIALEKKILNTARTIPEEAQYAQGLSYLVNQYLPYLPLESQTPAFYINTRQFNWPAASSDTWSTALVNDIAEPLMVDQEAGLLTTSGTSSSSTTTTATGSSSASVSTSTSFVTSTASSTSVSMSTTTSVSTSTLVTTQTSTVSNSSPSIDTTTLTAIAVVVVVLLIAIGVVLLRRRPAPVSAP